MKLHKITAQQYLDLLASGGDAYAATMEINGNYEKWLLRRDVLDKKYLPDNWKFWAGSSSKTKYFYTVVE